MTRRGAGAIVTAAIGGLFLSQSLAYRFGTPSDMGPGFFPTVLSCALIGLGIGLWLTRNAADDVHAQPVLPRPLVMIPAGMLVFALLVERAGVIPATTGLIVLSGFAEPRPSALRMLALAVGMGAFVYAVFILLLHLPFAVVRF